VKRYLLDTNTVSQLIKGIQPSPTGGCCAMASFCIRLLPGELLFAWQNGRMQAAHLVVQEFLRRVDVAALGQRHCEALWNHTGRYERQADTCTA